VACDIGAQLWRISCRHKQREEAAVLGATAGDSRVREQPTKPELQEHGRVVLIGAAVHNVVVVHGEPRQGRGVVLIERS
jgi:hypothetical protein